MRWLENGMEQKGEVFSSPFEIYKKSSRGLSFEGQVHRANRHRGS